MPNSITKNSKTRTSKVANPHPTPPNIVLNTKRKGEVAEAAFLHKAAALGFSVAKPWGESDRYDFILDTGARRLRVQIKSAHSSAVNGYSFAACGNVRGKRYTPRDIDFIIGYVVPGDVWYVIPIEAYAERTTIKVFPSSKRRMSQFEKYRDAWHYLRDTVNCSADEAMAGRARL